MSDIKGLIFDLDGVLWDSSLLHEKAYLMTFKNHVPKVASHFIYNNYSGKKTIETMKEITLLYSSNLSVEELTSIKQENVRKLLKKESVLYPKIYETLKYFSTKYKIGLATSASPETLEIFFEKSKTKEYFDIALNGSDVSNAKPNSEIYLKTIKALGLDAREIVVFEDSVNGIKAALAASLRVIGISSQISKNKLIKLGCIKAYDSIREYHLNEVS